MFSFFAPFALILCPADDPVKVTVVIVLATSDNDTIDPKLVELAKEVQKRDPKLTGFKLSATEVKSIPVGEGGEAQGRRWKGQPYHQAARPGEHHLRLHLR
jgi:acetaldehyde dehydrogenase (acetylating)